MGVETVGLEGESHPSSESEPVSLDECDGEGEVTEVETSEDRASRVGETEGDFEGDLRMGEYVGAIRLGSAIGSVMRKGGGKSRGVGVLDRAFDEDFWIGE